MENENLYENQEKKESFSLIKYIKTNKLICIILIVGLTLAGMIYSSTKRILQVVQQHNTIVNNMENSSDYNYGNLEEMIEELDEKIDRQSSNFKDVKISYGEVDAKNKTLELKFITVPKEYGSNMKITVNFGNYSKELIFSKNKFRGTVLIPYDEIYTEFLFTLKSNDKNITELVDVTEWDDSYEDLEDRFYSDFSGDFADYSVKLSKGKYILDINEIYYEYYGEDRNAQNVIFKIESNGKSVFSQEMKYNSEKERYETALKKCKLDYDKENKYEAYAEYIGKSGIKYRLKYFKLEYDENEDYVISYYMESEIIDNDNKKIIFKNMDE